MLTVHFLAISGPGFPASRRWIRPPVVSTYFGAANWPAEDICRVAPDFKSGGAGFQTRENRFLWSAIDHEDAELMPEETAEPEESSAEPN